jgi:hypothetical protein
MNIDLSVRERKRVVQLIDNLLSFSDQKWADKYNVYQLSELLVTNEKMNEDLSSREQAKVVKHIKDLQYEIIHVHHLDDLTSDIKELAELLIFE